MLDVDGAVTVTTCGAEPVVKDSGSRVPDGVEVLLRRGFGLTVRVGREAAGVVLRGGRGVVVARVDGAGGDVVLACVLGAAVEFVAGEVVAVRAADAEHPAVASASSVRAAPARDRRRVPIRPGLHVRI